jgi:hypothetical protein
MMPVKTCPIDREGCSTSCQAFDADLGGSSCVLIEGFVSVAKIGKLFDPELAGSMSGMMKLIAPTVLTRKAGLFRRKPKPGSDQ